MDIGGWLRNLGLGQYESAFRDNEIDGEVLPNLTADDLKELGVAIVGGLLVSQLLTLFTTPVIYLYFDRLATRFWRNRPAGLPEGAR